MKSHRRHFLSTVLATGTLLGFSNLIRFAFGMGAFKYKQGIQKISGDVRVNGKPVVAGDIVQPGDVVTTGPDSLVVFVLNQSVYLVRDNSRVELGSQSSEAFKEKIVDVIRILNGRMLSVFGKRRRKLIASTAVVGVRGTGIYIESEPGRTYVCTCYGAADLTPKADPQKTETVKTKYHDAPRFIYPAGALELIVTAPVFNHTDAELILLEELVWRKPPFVDQGVGESTGSSY